MSTICLGHSFLAATGFDYALQQPVFPGKLFLWALFMLSLLSWGVMVSKGITLFRMRRADEDFAKRYRASRQPLQIFERTFEEPHSLRWMVYEQGAGEAAFQMLGSAERDGTFAARLRASAGLTPLQMKSVREALGRGELAATARVRDGMPILNLTSMGAPFLGLLGMAWILMKTFSQGGMTGSLSEVSPGVSGALAMLVVGLIVATPALIGQILLGSVCREQMRKLGDFRSEVGRAIEHFYVAGHDAPLSAPSHQSRAGASHHAHPGSTASASHRSAGEFDGYAMEHAAASLEASADALAYADQSPFVLIDEPEMSGDSANRPIAAYAHAEDDLPPVEQGFLFRTPFTEAEINPIARQTKALSRGEAVLA